MDSKVFTFGDTAIAEMTDKELLKAIRKNEDSPNYPDSATTILVAEGVKRILASNVDLAEKRAEARQKVIDEVLNRKGDQDDD